MKKSNVLFFLIALVLVTGTYFVPNLVLLFLKVFGLILTVWVYSQSFYFIFIGLWGYLPERRDYPIIKDKTKFLVLVPAHNEETVIFDTVTDFNNLSYDRSLYDIYVICDNCTDSTVDICRNNHFKYIDTSENLFVRKGVGKPGALQYAMEYLSDNGEFKNYDMTVILDADNLVDRNFLVELNSQYVSKHHPEAIQVYLDSKNTKAFLSLGYAESYWTMNRFFQLAKYRLGLPNSIGGTGYAVKNSWLEDNNGFISKSLTEDLEMEIRIVESNGKILWNHFTRIYDEKPTRLKASLVQRTRWSKGHWYTAFHNFVPLTVLAIKKHDWKYVDQLNYLFSMRQNFVVVLLIVITVLNFFSGIFSGLSGNELVSDVSTTFSSFFVPKTGLNLAILLYGFIPYIYGYCADSRNPITVYRIGKSVLAILFFSITYYFSQLAGLFTFKNQSVWKHTAHSVTLSESSVTTKK